MEHVRNEELLPFHKLTEEEQQTIERENCKGNVERLDVLDRQRYQNISHLYPFSIYRTISQDEQEMQHEENNEFPWHMVSSEWNAVARDKNPYSWYLFNSKPLKGGATWYEEVYVEFDETVQKVIGVDMSKWNDIHWEDSLMLRPGCHTGPMTGCAAGAATGYEQQDTVEPAVEDTISDEEASVVYSSSTKEYPGATGRYPGAGSATGRYPVVKLKNLHKLSTGDVVRLKKTGELVELVEYTGCSGCKFFTYDADQHPCRKCGFIENAYVDYKPPTETHDKTFANTEMKKYADLDSKTKQLLEVKHKEGKVEFINCRGNWVKKNKVLDKFYNGAIYRVV